MIDQVKLQDVLRCYKRDFVSFMCDEKEYERWNEEKYKWEAVKCFQENWNLNAGNFSEMLKLALSKTKNLLASAGSFPRAMIEGFAQAAPEEVRAMFIALYDENKDIYERINAFKQQSEILLRRYGKGAKNHFQTENAISTYLWLWYPDKYYIYKYSVVQKVAEILGVDCQFRQGAYAYNIRSFLLLYEEISKVLKEDTELVDLFKKNRTDSCYPDPELKTLTVDLCFYIANFYEERVLQEIQPSLMWSVTDTNQPSSDRKDVNGEVRYWLMSYAPDQRTFFNMFIGEVSAFRINPYTHPVNNRNYYDAQIGDFILCFDQSLTSRKVAIGQIKEKQKGKKNEHMGVNDFLLIEKIIELTFPVTIGDLVKIPELSEMEYYSVNSALCPISLCRLSKTESCYIIKMLRDNNPTIDLDAVGLSVNQEKDLTELSSDIKLVEPYTKDDFLSEVYMTEERYNALAGVLLNKLNIILQGAPGVGKTFAARRLAWSIMGEKDDSRIEFVQFHQNYSYEDFMMGYKPAGDSFELKYGIFYRFCQKAQNQPDKPFFFIIDEINRGNMSKIFGELLMLIEKDYRGTKATLAYNGMPFSVPKNLYIIGMMNTADRSLAMIDYALRRRFSFFDIEPGFDSQGFLAYQNSLNNETLNALIAKVKDLNNEIAQDKSLGKGFCIGHSYFCGRTNCTEEWLRAVVDYDILPMLREYWFDETNKLQRWENILQGVFQS